MRVHKDFSGKTSQNVTMLSTIRRYRTHGGKFVIS